MQSLSLKKQLLLFIALISLALVGITFLIVLPAINTINQLREQIYESQRLLEERLQRTKLVKRSLQELTAIEKQMQEFKVTTFEEGEELKIITELENLAPQYNIRQTLNVAPVASPVKGLQAYTFSFLNHGLFADQIKYLKALEELPYYISINSIQWEKRKGETENGNAVTARFDGLIYATPIKEKK